jgi:hypothetical protein
MPIVNMNVVTARTALIDKKLFKYRSMVDETQKSRVRDVLLNHRIRFSRLSELNDPIEGKPILHLGDRSSAAYRQQYEGWVWNTQKHVASQPPKEVFLKWLRGLTKEQHEAYVEQINAGNHAAIEVKWRILSLSATPRQELMWSHYSDGHKGVALVFDASAGEFALAFRVTYVPERVSMDVTTQDPNEVLNATILTKRSTWAYEEEYRCIAQEPWERPLLRLEKQFLHFNPRQLLGVVFGSKLAAANAHALISWSKQRPVPLQFWKATITAAGDVRVDPHAP